VAAGILKQSTTVAPPSTIDIRTLHRSRRLPLAFLRGVGLPDALIDYLPSLLSQAIQHYSCFINYSSKTRASSAGCTPDLQDKGVRCWFASEDMKRRPWEPSKVSRSDGGTIGSYGSNNRRSTAEALRDRSGVLQGIKR
jgi:hypothetical protein